MTDVALRAGFDSIATFNRVFKQHEGVTPSNYRRMQQSLRQEARMASQARRDQAEDAASTAENIG